MKKIGTTRRDLGFFVRSVTVKDEESIEELMNVVRALRKARGSFIWKYVAAEREGNKIKIISGSSRYELVPWWDRVVCGATKVEMERDRVERRRLAVSELEFRCVDRRSHGKNQRHRTSHQIDCGSNKCRS